MEDEPRVVTYGSTLIAYRVRRSDRHTLDIAVLPDCSVEVVAPLLLDEEIIALRVQRRAGWILTQQSHFAQYLPRTPERVWVPGETHRYLGRQYRLRMGNVAADRPRLRLTRSFMMLDGLDHSDAAGIERTVRTWYRDRTREFGVDRVAACATRFADNPRPSAVTVREMRTRWASMSPSGRLTLNARLAQAPLEAVDYVITHELAHLSEPNHGSGFFALLGQVMPDHERRKQALERSMA